MSPRAQLSPLELELERLEDQYDVVGEKIAALNGDGTPERLAELEQKHEAIWEQLLKKDREIHPEWIEEDRRVEETFGLTDVQKRRWLQELGKDKAEWERWRYQRSKLPPAARGPMMEIGQRECRHEYCRRYFTPTNRRQVYHSSRCAKAAERLRKNGRGGQ